MKKRVIPLVTACVMTLFSLSGCERKIPTLNENSGAQAEEKSVYKMVYSVKPIHLTTSGQIPRQITHCVPIS